MIKRLLRCWRGDESLETYARVNDDAWAQWVGKSLHARVDSVIATRFTAIWTSLLKSKLGSMKWHWLCYGSTLQPQHAMLLASTENGRHDDAS